MYDFEMKETVDLALQLHPETRRIVVICGLSEIVAMYENVFRRQVATPSGTPPSASAVPGSNIVSDQNAFTGGSRPGSNRTV